MLSDIIQTAAFLQQSVNKELRKNNKKYKKWLLLCYFKYEHFLKDRKGNMYTYTQRNANSNGIVWSFCFLCFNFSTINM